MIKWDYKENDRSEFILTLIKGGYGLNDRLKLALNKEKEHRKYTRWRWKHTKQKWTPKGAYNEFKALKLKTNQLKIDERWRTTKNGEECSRIWSWKRHRSVTEAPRPWFSPSFLFSSLILSEIWLPKVLKPFPSAPTPFYSQNKGGACRPARPGELVASCRSFLMGLDGLKAEEHPLNWSVHPYFKFLAYFLLKHRGILWIAWQLALRSSMWSAKISMSTNNYPQTKLGYDTLIGCFYTPSEKSFKMRCYFCNLRQTPVTFLW